VKLLSRPVVLATISVVILPPLAIRAVEPGKPSVTALEVTAYRAIGAKHPDPTIRNDDYLAERFLGTKERAILRAAGSQGVLNALKMDTEAAWSSLGTGQAFATAVHARTRYIDGLFKEALASSATQVVILGAGLDSRAYRFADALGRVRVFEVDFPPTQEYKKKRVREVLGSLRPYVTYVPIDFAKEDLATVLNRRGYDQTQKTFFVWEGVTFYIPASAVDATLRFVANHSAPGSRIVFDYFLESGLTTPGVSALNKRLAALGEPFIFGIPDENREDFIARRGLVMAADVGINDLRGRYVPGRFTNAAAPSVNYVCTAVVPDIPKRIHAAAVLTLDRSFHQNRNFTAN
jgi:methyltransferase (TIGR00027 family)